MSSGYLNLAYLIEISVVFNLAYREIKHGSVLERMKQIREKMSKDKELQERIEEIKKDKSLAGEAVESSYRKLVAIIECDAEKSDDCKNTNSHLCEAWDHNKRHCNYFANTILTGKGLNRVNYSILASLLILVFATICPNINIYFSIVLWWAMFAVLFVTILIPIYLLLMSERVGNALMGKNSTGGLIERLERDFNDNYNKYLKEKAKADIF